MVHEKPKRGKFKTGGRGQKKGTRKGPGPALEKLRGKSVGAPNER